MNQESINALAVLFDGRGSDILEAGQGSGVIATYPAEGGYSMGEVLSVRALGDGRYSVTLSDMSSGTVMSLPAEAEGFDILNMEVLSSMARSLAPEGPAAREEAPEREAAPDVQSPAEAPGTPGGIPVVMAEELVDREAAARDADTLYLFTDNTNRSSGTNRVDPDSPYARLYAPGGEPLYYPRQSSAVWRGLPNAFPVSVQRYYVRGGDRSTFHWKEGDFEEFRRVVDDEFARIEAEVLSGRWRRVMLPKGGLMDGELSEFNEMRVPTLYHYMSGKLAHLREVCANLSELQRQAAAATERQAPSGTAAPRRITLLNEEDYRKAEEADRQRIPAVEELTYAPLSEVAAVAARTGGVNALRSARFEGAPGMHFGNPSSHEAERMRGATVKAESVARATRDYRDWLIGARYQDLEPERRSWIVRSILGGGLYGKPIVYYTDTIPVPREGADWTKGYGDEVKYSMYKAPNHAHVLLDLVNHRARVARTINALSTIRNTRRDPVEVSRWFSSLQPAEMARVLSLKGMRDSEMLRTARERVVEMNSPTILPMLDPVQLREHYSNVFNMLDPAVREAAYNQALVERYADGLPVTGEAVRQEQGRAVRNIHAGTQENTLLSNLYDRDRSFVYRTPDGKDVEFRSVEQGFQYMKSYYSKADPSVVDGYRAAVLATTSGRDLRRYGSASKLLLDTASWDRDNAGVMLSMLRLAYDPRRNPSAADALRSTGEDILTHVQDRGKWRTVFPEMLMRVRAELLGWSPGRTEAYLAEVMPVVSGGAPVQGPVAPSPENPAGEPERRRLQEEAPETATGRTADPEEAAVADPESVRQERREYARERSARRGAAAVLWFGHLTLEEKRRVMGNLRRDGASFAKEFNAAARLYKDVLDRQSAGLAPTELAAAYDTMFRAFPPVVQEAVYDQGGRLPLLWFNALSLEQKQEVMSRFTRPDGPGAGVVPAYDAAARLYKGVLDRRDGGLAGEALSAAYDEMFAAFSPIVQTAVQELSDGQGASMRHTFIDVDSVARIFEDKRSGVAIVTEPTSMEPAAIGEYVRSTGAFPLSPVESLYRPPRRGDTYAETVAFYREWLSGEHPEVRPQQLRELYTVILSGTLIGEPVGILKGSVPEGAAETVEGVLKEFIDHPQRVVSAINGNPRLWWVFREGTRLDRPYRADDLVKAGLPEKDNFVLLAGASGLPAMDPYEARAAVLRQRYGANAEAAAAFTEGCRRLSNAEAAMREVLSLLSEPTREAIVSGVDAALTQGSVKDYLSAHPLPAGRDRDILGILYGTPGGEGDTSERVQALKAELQNRSGEPVTDESAALILSGLSTDAEDVAFAKALTGLFSDDSSKAILEGLPERPSPWKILDAVEELDLKTLTGNTVDYLEMLRPNWPNGASPATKDALRTATLLSVGVPGEVVNAVMGATDTRAAIMPFLSPEGRSWLMERSPAVDEDEVRQNARVANETYEVPEGTVEIGASDAAAFLDEGGVLVSDDSENLLPPADLVDGLSPEEAAQKVLSWLTLASDAAVEPARRDRINALVFSGELLGREIVVPERYAWYGTLLLSLVNAPVAHARVVDESIRSVMERGRGRGASEYESAVQFYSGEAVRSDVAQRIRDDMWFASLSAVQMRAVLGKTRFPGDTDTEEARSQKAFIAAALDRGWDSMTLAERFSRVKDMFADHSAASFITKEWVDYLSREQFPTTTRIPSVDRLLESFRQKEDGTYDQKRWKGVGMERRKELVKDFLEQRGRKDLPDAILSSIASKDTLPLVTGDPKVERVIAGMDPADAAEVERILSGFMLSNPALMLYDTETWKRMQPSVRFDEVRRAIGHVPGVSNVLIGKLAAFPSLPLTRNNQDPRITPVLDSMTEGFRIPRWREVERHLSCFPSGWTASVATIEAALSSFMRSEDGAYDNNGWAAMSREDRAAALGKALEGIPFVPSSLADSLASLPSLPLDGWSRTHQVRQAMAGALSTLPGAVPGGGDAWKAMDRSERLAALGSVLRGIPLVNPAYVEYLAGLDVMPSGEVGAPSGVSPVIDPVPIRWEDMKYSERIAVLEEYSRKKFDTEPFIIRRLAELPSMPYDRRDPESVKVIRGAEMEEWRRSTPERRSRLVGDYLSSLAVGGELTDRQVLDLIEGRAKAEDFGLAMQVLYPRWLDREKARIGAEVAKTRQRAVEALYPDTGQVRSYQRRQRYKEGGEWKERLVTVSRHERRRAVSGGNDGRERYLKEGVRELLSAGENPYGNVKGYLTSVFSALSDTAAHHLADAGRSVAAKAVSMGADTNETWFNALSWTGKQKALGMVGEVAPDAFTGAVDPTDGLGIPSVYIERLGPEEPVSGGAAENIGAFLADIVEDEEHRKKLLDEDPEETEGRKEEMQDKDREERDRAAQKRMDLEEREYKGRREDYNKVMERLYADLFSRLDPEAKESVRVGFENYAQKFSAMDMPSAREDLLAAFADEGPEGPDRDRTRAFLASADLSGTVGLERDALVKAFFETLSNDSKEYILESQKLQYDFNEWFTAQPTYRMQKMLEVAAGRMPGSAARERDAIRRELAPGWAEGLTPSDAREKLTALASTFGPSAMRAVKGVQFALDVQRTQVDGLPYQVVYTGTDTKEERSAWRFLTTIPSDVDVVVDCRYLSKGLRDAGFKGVISPDELRESLGGRYAYVDLTSKSWALTHPVAEDAEAQLVPPADIASDPDRTEAWLKAETERLGKERSAHEEAMGVLRRFLGEGKRIALVGNYSNPVSSDLTFTALHELLREGRSVGYIRPYEYTRTTRVEKEDGTFKEEKEYSEGINVLSAEEVISRFVERSGEQIIASGSPSEILFRRAAQDEQGPRWRYSAGPGVSLVQSTRGINFRLFSFDRANYGTAPEVIFHRDRIDRPQMQEEVARGVDVVFAFRTRGRGSKASPYEKVGTPVIPVWLPADRADLNDFHAAYVQALKAYKKPEERLVVEDEEDTVRRAVTVSELVENRSSSRAWEEAMARVGGGPTDEERQALFEDLYGELAVAEDPAVDVDALVKDILSRPALSDVKELAEPSLRAWLEEDITLRRSTEDMAAALVGLIPGPTDEERRIQAEGYAYDLILSGAYSAPELRAVVTGPNEAELFERAGDAKPGESELAGNSTANDLIYKESYSVRDLRGDYTEKDFQTFVSNYLRAFNMIGAGLGEDGEPLQQGTMMDDLGSMTFTVGDHRFTPARIVAVENVGESGIEQMGIIAAQEQKLSPTLHSNGRYELTHDIGDLPADVAKRLKGASAYRGYVGSGPEHRTVWENPYYMNLRKEPTPEERIREAEFSQLDTMTLYDVRSSREEDAVVRNAFWDMGFPLKDAMALADAYGGRPADAAGMHALLASHAVLPTGMPLPVDRTRSAVTRAADASWGVPSYDMQDEALVDAREQLIMGAVGRHLPNLEDCMTALWGFESREGRPAISAQDFREVVDAAPFAFQGVRAEALTEAAFKVDRLLSVVSSWCSSALSEGESDVFSRTVRDIRDWAAETGRPLSGTAALRDWLNDRASQLPVRFPATWGEDVVGEAVGRAREAYAAILEKTPALPSGPDPVAVLALQRNMPQERLPEILSALSRWEKERGRHVDDAASLEAFLRDPEGAWTVLEGYHSQVREMEAGGVAAWYALARGQMADGFAEGIGLVTAGDPRFPASVSRMQPFERETYGITGAPVDPAVTGRRRPRIRVRTDAGGRTEVVQPAAKESVKVDYERLSRLNADAEVQYFSLDTLEGRRGISAALRDGNIPVAVSNDNMAEIKHLDFIDRIRSSGGYVFTPLNPVDEETRKEIDAIRDVLAVQPSREPGEFGGAYASVRTETETAPAALHYMGDIGLLSEDGPAPVAVMSMMNNQVSLPEAMRAARAVSSRICAEEGMVVAVNLYTQGGRQAAEAALSAGKPVIAVTPHPLGSMADADLKRRIVDSGGLVLSETRRSGEGYRLRSGTGMSTDLGRMAERADRLLASIGAAAILVDSWAPGERGQGAVYNAFMAAPGEKRVVRYGRVRAKELYQEFRRKADFSEAAYEALYRNFRSEGITSSVLERGRLGGSYRKGVEDYMAGISAAGDGTTSQAQLGGNVLAERMGVKPVTVADDGVAELVRAIRERAPERFALRLFRSNADERKLNTGREVHVDTVGFSQYRRGPRRVFVVRPSEVDVIDTLRREYGREVNIVGTAREAKALLALPGDTEPFQGARIAPEPVAEVPMYWHRGTLYTEDRFPGRGRDNLPEFRQRAEQAGMALEAATQARTIQLALQRAAGYGGDLLLELSDGVHFRNITRRGFEVWQGGVRVAEARLVYGVFKTRNIHPIVHGSNEYRTLERNFFPSEGRVASLEALVDVMRRGVLNTREGEKEGFYRRPSVVEEMQEYLNGDEYTRTELIKQRDEGKLLMERGNLEDVEDALSAGFENGLVDPRTADGLSNYDRTEAVARLLAVEDALLAEAAGYAREAAREGEVLAEYEQRYSAPGNMRNEGEALARMKDEIAAAEVRIAALDDRRREVMRKVDTVGATIRDVAVAKEVLLAGTSSERVRRAVPADEYARMAKTVSRNARDMAASLDLFVTSLEQKVSGMGDGLAASLRNAMMGGAPPAIHAPEDTRRFIAGQTELLKEAAGRIRAVADGVVPAGKDAGDAFARMAGLRTLTHEMRLAVEDVRAVYVKVGATMKGSAGEAAKEQDQEVGGAKDSLAVLRSCFPSLAQRLAGADRAIGRLSGFEDELAPEKEVERPRLLLDGRTLLLPAAASTPELRERAAQREKELRSEESELQRRAEWMDARYERPVTARDILDNEATLKAQAAGNTYQIVPRKTGMYGIGIGENVDFPGRFAYVRTAPDGTLKAISGEYRSLGEFKRIGGQATIDTGPDIVNIILPDGNELFPRPVHKIEGYTRLPAGDEFIQVSRDGLYNAVHVQSRSFVLDKWSASRITITKDEARGTFIGVDELGKELPLKVPQPEPEGTGQRQK